MSERTNIEIIHDAEVTTAEEQSFIDTFGSLLHQSTNMLVAFALNELFNKNRKGKGNGTD